MISSKEVFEAIEAQVRRVIEVPVTPNFVEDPESSYVWVRMRERRVDEGYQVVRRAISVDIQVILKAGTIAVQSARLYEISDGLGRVFSGVLSVGARRLTLYDTAANIYDGILTYSLELRFTDYIEKLDAPEEYDEMQELYIKENQNVRKNRN